MPATYRTIRTATPSDLKYLVHLQKRWSNDVGFLPRQALLDYLERRGALIITQNAEPCGYLLFRPSKRGIVRIPQVAIDPELLRSTAGTCLLSKLKHAATANGCFALRALSRTDTLAHLFFPAIGFTATAVLPAPSKRHMPVIEWTHSLLTPAITAQAMLRTLRTAEPTHAATAIGADVRLPA